jgi:DNA-binding winged helix-turn-helix (wHTH) protein
MESEETSPFVLDNWEVVPSESLIRALNDQEIKRLSPRAMEVLISLAQHFNEVLSIDDLLDLVWHDVIVGPNAVQKCINELRRALGDPARNPRFIQTIPKRGYKLMIKPRRPDANQQPVEAQLPSSSHPSKGVSGKTSRLSDWAVASLAVAMALVIGFFLASKDDSTALVATARVGDEDIALVIFGNDDQSENDSSKTIASLALAELESAPVTNIRQLRMSRQEAEALNADRVLKIEHNELGRLVSLETGNAHHSHFDDDARRNGDNVQTLKERLEEDIALLTNPSIINGLEDWGTTNPHALSLYKRGELYSRRYDPASLHKAAALFADSVDLDGEFVEGYLALASITSTIGCLATSAEQREAAIQDLLNIRDLAIGASLEKEAVDLIEAQVAWISAVHPLQLEQEWFAQLQADSQDSFILRRYSTLLTGAGLTEEATDFVQRAIRFARDEADRRASAAQLVTLTGHSSKEAQIPQMEQYIKQRPNALLTLYALVATLSDLKRFVEAERYLHRLRQVDEEGLWAHTAWMHFAVRKGELMPDSDVLRAAMADPRATNIGRGAIYFALGDVPQGVAAWRNIESGLVPLLWQYRRGMESRFADNVVSDERYQHLLDDLGVGRRWRNHLIKRVDELSEHTGISAVTPIEVQDLTPVKRFAAVKIRQQQQTESGI